MRLTDAGGRVFEDTVDDGVVLFMSGETVAMPMRLDLYDREGCIVAADEWVSKRSRALSRGKGMRPINKS